jgi:hypothetical protein
MLGGLNSRMEDQAFKNSTTPASLSIFFLDPSADYKYSGTGSGAAGYMSSENIFKLLCQGIAEKNLQLFVPNSKRLKATPSGCTFFFRKVHTTRRS